MTHLFANKTALITGAASGIGEATAQRLIVGGIQRLILVDCAPIDAAAFDGPAHIDTLIGDVGDPDLWARAQPLLTGIDHVVVNAGIGHAAPIVTHDFADWRRVMSVNLDGAFLTLQAAMQAFAAAGTAGSAVIVASAAGIKAEPATSAYGVSKAAALHLARIAAKEGAATGVRVNAIAPGGVDTPIWDKMPFFAELVAREGSREAAIAAMGRMGTPIGHYATADEIAGQIAFLLSDAAASITGATLVTDGGYTL